MTKKLEPVRIEGELDDDVYDDMLHDIYPDDVNICGMDMDPVYILKEMDPTAYRCGKNDIESSGDFDKWQCPVCSEEFDTESEAQDCIDNHEEEKEEEESKE